LAETASSGEQLLSFLLASETRSDMLIFFHRNPNVIDTAEGIALRIGSSRGRIQKDLDELVSLGILGRRQLGQREIIFLNAKRDKQIQDAIARHAESLLR
jgi:predicted transcriptional regulator